MSALVPAHLCDAAKRQLELPVPERIASILRERFICHAELEVIIGACRALTHGPRLQRPRGALVLGECGSGKTTAAAWLRQSLPARLPTSAAPPHRPVISINLCGVRSDRDVHERLLWDLGCGYVGHIPLADRRSMVMDLLHAADTRLLVVDDVQDLDLVDKANAQRAVSAIKQIMNDARLPLVCFGIPRADMVLARDSQLNARLTRYFLPAWEPNEHLAQFLDALEATLPLTRRSHLSSITTMRELIRLCGPSIAEITRRVQEAAALAVELGDACVTRDLLKRSRHEPLQHALRLAP
jgi:hypothetical protein